MKKNILVILLSATLLTGCEVDLGIIKIGGDQTKEPATEQKQEEQNQNSQENQGENQSSGENQQQGGGEQGGGEQGGGGQQHTDPLEQEYTATVLTSGTQFATLFPGGSHFDTESKKEALFNFLDDQLEYKNLISSIVCDNLHTQKYDSATYMSFGSQNGSGSFKWNSLVKIYRVEVTVQSYAKYVDYTSTYNVDQNSKFYIDEDLCQLTFDSNNLPEMQTYTKNFTEGVTSFTLSSLDGRAFLKDMKITWRG